MPFTTDTDQDGAGWDNALDKLAMVGGAGIGALGAGVGAIGATMFGAGLLPTPATSPLLLPGGLALASLGGALAAGGGMLGTAGGLARHGR